MAYGEYETTHDNLRTVQVFLAAAFGAAMTFGIVTAGLEIIKHTMANNSENSAPATTRHPQ